MLIDLIVGTAVLLAGVYCWFWLRDPELRARIEQPKHVFLAHVHRQDGSRSAESAATNRRTTP